MLGYGSMVNCEEYPTTLPGVLVENGYRTVVVGKNHFGESKSNKGNREYITHGYEELQLYEGIRAIYDDYDAFFNTSFPGVDPLLSTCGLDFNSWMACPYAHDEYYHPTSWTTRQALDYLNDWKGNQEPTLLKISYHRPHSPYDPPQRLWDKHMALKHEDAYARIIDNTQWDAEWLNFTEMNSDAFFGDPGEDAARKARAAYYANVEYVDEGIGSILTALENEDEVLRDDVFIIWTTDHGDMNGDHNLWRKGYPWEGSSHVNMLMRTMGQTEGRISDAIVETRDVTPTIFDIVGTLDNIKSRDPLVNGMSLLPILEGRVDSVRDMLDLEHSVVYDKRLHWNAIVGFKEGKLYKYIFFVPNGKEYLFCLTDDPNESNDLAGAVSDKTEALVGFWRNAMVDQFEREGRGDEWVLNGKLASGRRGITFGPNYACPHEDASFIRESIAVE